MSNNLIKLATAAFAGSILGIVYERMPPTSQWVDPFKAALADASIVPRSGDRLGKSDDQMKPMKVDVINPSLSAENLKHSAKFGLPSRDNLRVFNDYILSYDRRLRAANWVIEHLTPEKLKHVENGVHRGKSKFHEDYAIHEYFRAKNADFLQSGYDRGHMAAAGNHKLNQDDLDQTFAFSNVSPQVAELNRGIWERLESYVRWRAKRSKNLYVVTGPLYLPMKARDNNLYVTYRVLGETLVSVPTHYFKVFLIETENNKLVVEAFLMPNSKIDGSSKLDDFRIPKERLDMIERAAGVIFFDQISRDQLIGQQALEAGFKDADYSERKKLKDK